jgi:hypothetical protein
VVIFTVITLSVIILSVILPSVTASVIVDALKIGVAMLFNKNPQKFYIQSSSSGAISNSFGAMAFCLLAILSNNKNRSK